MRGAALLLVLGLAACGVGGEPERPGGSGAFESPAIQNGIEPGVSSPSITRPDVIEVGVDEAPA
ncbi:hypothetical protein RM543_03380 [Roseicyclus sp. F158]|uniref:Argininosuccinate lyase n=1 Tax=Tropicimonas omnivorans TaxID=3075590 RepID=A0ABU3DDB7_9RHOB|nr:hypothetical protein [Roseicyclus sp. F158]MDT0681715.1 hypothetical protein [Roseicyclus sp. F158]